MKKIKKIWTAIISSMLFFCLFYYSEPALATVNSDGSFTYKVPVKVVPGTHGLQPALALLYNSNNRDGIVGIGWKLAGLPVISRDPMYPIKHDENDRFTAGQGPLVTLDGVTYYYKEERFSRFERDSTNNMWIETRPDGTKYYYGSTGDSQIQAIGKDDGICRAWALSRIEDVHGNYIVIEYHDDTTLDDGPGGEIYPKRIVYTMNDGITSYRAVEFEYETRNDYCTGYRYKSAVTTKYRLKEIVVKSGITDILGLELSGDTVRKYELVYDPSFDTSKLQKINEYDSNNVLFDTIEFEWDKLDSGNEFTQVGSLPQSLVSAGDDTSDTHLYTGDFNGDGVTDILWHNPHTGANNWFYRGEICYYKTNRIAASLLDKSDSLYSYEERCMYLGDWNGDGLTDVMWYDNESGTNRWFVSRREFAEDGTGRHYFDGYSANLIDAAQLKGVEYLYTGDWNGDGLTDLLWWNQDNGSNRWFINTGTGFTSKQEDVIPLSQFYDSSDSELCFGDWNGDGRTDVAMYDLDTEHDYWHISTSSGTSVSFESYSEKVTPSPGAHELIFGDWNGDGITDLMRYRINGNNYWYTQKGNMQFEYRENPISPSYLAGSDGGWTMRDYKIFDFYPDGRSDFFAYNNIKNWNRWFISVNGTYNINNAIYNPISRSEEYYKRLFYGNSDNIGNKYLMFYQYRSSGAGSNEIYTIKLKAPDRIKTVTTSTGGSIAITYDETHTVTDTNGDAVTYPYVSDKFKRYLVKDIEISDGRGATYKTSYDYKNGKIYTGQPYERKNLLFESMTETNQQTGQKKVTYYKQDNHYFHGKKTRVEIYDGSGRLTKTADYSYYGDDKDDSDTSEIATQNQYRDVDGNVQNTTFIRTKMIFVVTYEKGNTVHGTVKSFEYNQYGAVTKVTDMAAGCDDIETEIDYVQNPERWLLNRPAEVRSYANGILKRHKRFSYQDIVLASKEEYLDTQDRWITTSYTYDQYGNVQSITDALGNVDQLVYDDDYHAYVVKHIDPAGLETIYTINDKFGLVESVTDPNDNTTQYEYDDSGRLLFVKEPGDEWTRRINYHDELKGDANAQYIETQYRDSSEPGYHFRRIYYDGLERVYHTESKADNDHLVVTEREFDAGGRLFKESNPYIKDLDSVYYTTYYYDEAGRVSQVVAPYGDGAVSDTVTYSYDNGRRVVVYTNDKGRQYTSEYDARNRLREKREPENASLEYYYTPLGELRKTIQNNYIETNIYYDSLGRRTSIDDPNSGQSYYTYDDLGRLTSMTDARGLVNYYVYDKNYLVQEYSSDGSINVNYTYGDEETSVANAIGRLVSVSNGTSSSEYSYNTKGLVNNAVTTVEDRNFAFHFTYDTQGRLSELTYPDNSVVKNRYADAGYLQTVSLDDGALVHYSRTRSDGSGSATLTELQRVTGNGIFTRISYDPASLRLTDIKTERSLTGNINVDIDIDSYNVRSFATRSEESEVIDHLGYQYDTVGNITAITDNLDSSYNQSFGYDGLSRLVSAQGIYGNRVYEYDNYGNLRTKGSNTAESGNIDVDVDIDSYNVRSVVTNSDSEGITLDYQDTSHPFAVTGDSRGNSYTYDANGNMATRNSLTFSYDAKNRLTALSNGEQYSYNFAGNRVKKISSDSTVTYSIAGLYEIIQVPGQDEKHARYVYGIGGELVSKLEADGSQLADARTVTSGRYALFTIEWFAMGTFCVMDSIKDLSGNGIVRMLHFAGLVGLLLLCFVSIKRVNKRIYLLYRWRAIASPLVLVAFLGTLAGSGCFGDDVEGYNYTHAHSTDTLYFHPDHINSIYMITNGEAEIVSRQRFTPYGELIQDHSTGTDVSPFKYTSQEMDSGSGLYFYGARYYDPGIGRFIQPDPLVDGVHTTQGFNRYMYVHGNPINMFDSTGYSSEGYTFEIGFGGSEGGYSGGNSGSGYGYDVGGYNITVGMQGNSSEYHTYSGGISSTASYDNTPVEEAGSNSFTQAWDTNMEVLFGDDRSLTNLDFGWDYFKAIWSTLDRFTETPTAELSMQLQIYQGAFQAEFALSVLGAYYTAGALVEVRAMYQAWAAGGSLFGVGNELVKNPGIVNGLRQVAKIRINDLLNAANKPFGTGQFTVAGRALTKHPNIVGAENAQALYKLYGNQIGINNAAVQAIRNIIQNGTYSTKMHKVFGNIIDYKLSNGLGVRFSADTYEFIHFLGRGVK